MCNLFPAAILLLQEIMVVMVMVPQNLILDVLTLIG